MNVCARRWYRRDQHWRLRADRRRAAAMVTWMRGAVIPRAGRVGARRDSHAMGPLEYPLHTPPNIAGQRFRRVAGGRSRSGRRWRRREAIGRTGAAVDLLLAADLSAEERWFLAELAGGTRRCWCNS